MTMKIITMCGRGSFGVGSDDDGGTSAGVDGSGGGGGLCGDVCRDSGNGDGVGVGGDGVDAGGSVTVGHFIKSKYRLIPEIRAVFNNTASCKKSCCFYEASRTKLRSKV
jgi:hypothetical protein